MKGTARPGREREDPGLFGRLTTSEARFSWQAVRCDYFERRLKVAAVGCKLHGMKHAKRVASHDSMTAKLAHLTIIARST